MSLKFLIHYSLHYVVPLGIALFFYKEKWKVVYLVLIATMLVDLDHLLANPIYNPNRCSINFHPLHSYYAIGVYTLMLVPKKVRIIAVGLLLHMIADTIDCFL